MKDFFIRTYHYCEAIPDKLYPFASEIEGKMVRGQQSYSKALSNAWERYGEYHMGYKLTMYRGVFHFIGSLLFIIFSTVISHQLFGSEVALNILVAVAITALFIQEFYVHPRQYNQLRLKGISDWLTWVLPMMAYLFLLR